jgi:WD40 repeat protein/serine/threonine protein kinase
MSHQPSTDDRLDQVIADYFQRLDQGESVSPLGLVAEHPDLELALREFFDAANYVEQLAGPTQAEQTQMLSVHDTARNSLVGQTIIATAAPSPSRTLLKEGKIPAYIGRYRIDRLLGQGAMGAVYLAHDPHLQRPIALKIPKLSDEENADLSARFVREARSAALLRHANICPVYEVGRIDGMHYITMAYIEGKTLAEELRARRTFQAREIAQIVRKLALALAKAHSAGVVHRDLKPGNIMLDGEGEPVLMDFGLAYREQTDELRLTKSGMIVGSPAYMSPEQLDGNPEKIGAASDIYSLGVVLYEMLTGKLPFQGSMMSVIGQIANKEPAPVGQWRPELADSPLERLCRKMMAKEPAGRPGSMQEIAAALDYIVAGLPGEGGASEGPDAATSMLLGVPPIRSLVSAPKPEASVHAAETKADVARRLSKTYVPPEIPETSSQERRERAGLFLATTLLLLLVVGFFGALAGVVYVVTDQGTLEITSHVDGIQVELTSDRGDVKIVDLASGTELQRLKSGEYKIKLVGNRPDVRLDASGFKLSRGDTVLVTAQLVPGMPPGGGVEMLKPPDGVVGAGLPGPQPLAGPPPLARWDDHFAEVRSAAFAPGSNQFVTVGWDRMIHVHDARTRRVVRSWQGHDEGVYRAQYLPDGRLVTCSYDGTIRLWDPTTGNMLQRLGAHAGPVTALSVAPDGKHLLTGGRDEIVRYWDLDDLDQPRKLTTDEGKNWAWDAAISPDGKSAASVGFDGKVRLWDLAEGKQTASWVAHEGAVLAVAYLSDGKELITGGRDGLVKVWDTTTHQVLRAFEDFRGAWIENIAVSPDGQHVLVAVSNPDLPDAKHPAAGRGAVLDVATLEIQAFLDTRAQFSFTTAWSPDGSMLLVGGGTRGSRGTAQLWPAEMLRRVKAPKPLKAVEIQSLEGHDEYLLAIALARGETIVASAGADRAILLWDLVAGGSRATPKLHENQVRAIAFTPDFKQFITASNDRTLRLWNTDSLADEGVLTGHSDHVSSVVVLPDGKRAISGSDDKSLRVWDLATNKPLFRADFHVGVVSCLALSPDGTLLASGGGDNHVIVSKVEGDKLVFQRRLVGHIAEIRGLAFAPDGKSLVSSSRDGAVRVWNSDQGNSIRVINPNLGAAYCVAISPSGELLAVGGGDWQQGGVKLYDLATGTELAEIKSPKGFVHALAFTPDSQKLVSGSADGAVRIWQLERPAATTGTTAESPAEASKPVEPIKPVARLEGHGGPIFGLAVTADGQTALSTSDDYYTNVWNLAAGEKAAAHKSDGAMRCVAVTADGSRAAWSGGQMSIVVWDLKQNKELTTLRGHTNWVYSLQFAKDNRQLLSASRDQTVRLWDLATGKTTLQLETINREDVIARLSPDETRILASSDNFYTLTLWNVADGQPHVKLHGHGVEGVFAAAFSPDGKQIATADARGFIFLRDAVTGEPRKTWRGHQGRVTSLEFTPDSRHLVSGGFDKQLNLWDSQSGRLVGAAQAEDPVTNYVAVLAEGRQVISAGGWRMTDEQQFEQPGDFAVHVWDLPSVAHSRQHPATPVP